MAPEEIPAGQRIAVSRMTVFTLRLLAAVVGFLLLLVIARRRPRRRPLLPPRRQRDPEPHHLASLLSLDELRDKIGRWLESLEADGPVAALAALCGPARSCSGSASRRRPGAAARTAPGRRAHRPRHDRRPPPRRGQRPRRSCRDSPREVLGAKAKVSPNRSRPGGRARLKLTAAAGTDERPRPSSPGRELEVARRGTLAEAPDRHPQAAPRREDDLMLRQRLRFEGSTHRRRRRAGSLVALLGAALAYYGADDDAACLQGQPELRQRPLWLPHRLRLPLRPQPRRHLLLPTA